jgi:hypothetical protein
MDPRRWSGRRVALFILAWPVGVVGLALLLAGGLDAASGPSGGLIGISAGVAWPLAVIVLGPPAIVLALWLAGRSHSRPPAV